MVWTPNAVDVERWRLLPADERRRDEVRGLLGAPEHRVIGLFGDLKAKKRIPLWLEAVRDRRLLSRMSLLVVGNLDQETGGRIIELMFGLARTRHASVLLITHDPSLAEKADRQLHMNQGRLS